MPLLDPLQQTTNQPANDPYQPAPYQPNIKPIDPAQETVAGRLPGILDPESALMKRAKYGGEAYAAKRGLLESTLAGEAGMAAMIDRATPIAQQDAQTYSQQRLAAQQLGSEFTGREQEQAYGLQKMGRAAELETGQMGVAQQYELERQELAANQQLTQMEKQQALNAKTLELEADVNERLYGVQQQYALELEGLRKTYEIQQNLDTTMGGLYSDGLKSISNLLDNPDMSAEQQEVGLNVIIGNLQSGLNFLAGISGEPAAAGEFTTGTASEGATPAGPMTVGATETFEARREEQPLEPGSYVGERKNMPVDPSDPWGSAGRKLMRWNGEKWEQEG